MARAKKDKAQAGTGPAPDVDQLDITRDLLPDGVPTLPDGSVAEDVEMDADAMRLLGAADKESAQHNQAEAEYVAKLRRGDKDVRFGDSDALARYETTLKVFGAERLRMFVQRVDPQPVVNLPPLAAVHIRNGQQLYDVLMRSYHKQSPESTYFIRVREGGSDRCQFRITLPDTTAQGPSFGPGGYGMTMPQQQQQGGPMPPPWAQQGYPQQGYMPAPVPSYAGYAPQYEPQPPAPPPPAAPPPAPIAPVPPPAPAPVAAAPMPVPPATMDPAIQSWMGAIYQQSQEQARMIAELRGALERASQTDQAKILAYIDDVRAGRVPSTPTAAIGPAGLGGVPPLPFAVPAPPSPTREEEEIAALRRLPRPAAWPAHLAWPPDPRQREYWVLEQQYPQPPPPQYAQPAYAPSGFPHPVPAGYAPPPPVPLSSAPVSADPYAEVKRNFEAVGQLVSLVDRMRGVAPAVGQVSASEGTLAPPEPANPRTVEMIKVGDIDVAIKPDTGDIHWMHTLVGAMPRILDFAGKFTDQAALTARTHAVAQAVQSGKMPVQYIPPPRQEVYEPPQVQYAPPPPQPLSAAAPIPQAGEVVVEGPRASPMRSMFG